MGYGNQAGYGRGDYYAGDYYAGDPFLGGLLARAGGALFGGLFGKKSPGTAVAPYSAPNIGIMASGGGTIGSAAAGVNPGSIGGAIEKWMTAHPFITGAAGLVSGGALAKASAGLMALGGRPLPAAPGMAMMTLGHGARRMHPNKSTYVTRRDMQLHPRGSTMVPTRRMNVANPRALRRSLRRVAGFAKLTKRVRHAVSMAASAVGVHRGARRKTIRRR
jgi:hypothetical protein